MGIERARVVEVHSGSSATGRVGSGYLVNDRLVLTSGGIVGRQGSTAVRPAGTAVWVSASLVWSAQAGDAALLEVEEPSALMMSPDALRWGQVAGRQPVAVTAIGFPPAPVRPDTARDTEQFFGRLVPDGSTSADLSVEAVTAKGSSALVGDGMSGAALFAGADLVGVLLAAAGPPPRLRAVPVARLADDPSFVELVGTEQGLALTPVRARWGGFPILQAP